MKEIAIPNDKNVFVTADTHYHHRNIIKYCKRPWLGQELIAALDRGEEIEVSNSILEAHDAALIENTNAVVSKDDILIHCGDVAWGYNALKEYASLINCKNVIAVYGNHDRDSDIDWFFDSYERIRIVHRGRTAIVDHYPGDSWMGSHRGNWLLYGHVHGKATKRRLEIPFYLLSHDCGVDSNDYTPISWEHFLMPLMDKRRIQWKEAIKGYMRVPKEQGGMAVEDDMESWHVIKH